MKDNISNINDENNALLESIINKGNISNSIIISKNDLFINFISEKLVNHFISIKKKSVFYL